MSGGPLRERESLRDFPLRQVPRPNVPVRINGNRGAAVVRDEQVYDFAVLDSLQDVDHPFRSGIPRHQLATAAIDQPYLPIGSGCRGREGSIIHLNVRVIRSGRRPCV